jgi:hypothetical protein
VTRPSCCLSSLTDFFIPAEAAPASHSREDPMAESPGLFFPTTATRNIGRGLRKKRRMHHNGSPCAKHRSRGGASCLLITALCTQGRLLSTASTRPRVQTVGNTGRNNDQITALPPYPFLGAWFSKTGGAAITATRLVTTILSTFPAQSVTATNKEEMFCVFRRSRRFWFHVIHRNNTGEILRQLRGGVE